MPLATDNVLPSDEIVGELAAAKPPMFPCPSCGRETKEDKEFGWRVCSHPNCRQLFFAPSPQRVADLLRLVAELRRRAEKAEEVAKGHQADANAAKARSKEIHQALGIANDELDVLRQELAKFRK